MSKEVTLLNATDNEYVELTGILLGEKDRVEVTVEDEFDVPFWFDLLQSVKPDATYHVTPYQYGESNTTKGKAHILQMAENGQLGAHNIGCVDADYDYLRQSESNDWQKMQSRWILHTYAYSVENLMCHPQTLQQACVDATMDTPDYDFNSLFEDISKTVYPLLVWSMYMEEIKSSDFTAKSWGKIFDSTNTSNTSYSRESIISKLEARVNTAINDLKIKHPDSDNKLTLCENIYLKTNHVESKSCYQFVRGHDLFEFIRDVLLKPLTSELVNKHISTIKSSKDNPGDDINHYKNHLIKVETVLQRNYRYKNYPSFYDKIKADAEKALA